MAPWVPATILESARQQFVQTEHMMAIKGGYGCLLMETVKDRPNGAIFGTGHTYNYYTITAGILNTGTQQFWISFWQSQYFCGGLYLKINIPYDWTYYIPRRSHSNLFIKVSQNIQHNSFALTLHLLVICKWSLFLLHFVYKKCFDYCFLLFEAF